MQVSQEVASHPERSVALETTLLVHGVPREVALDLHDELDDLIRSAEAVPALIGVIAGEPVAGMTRDALRAMLDQPQTPKLNASNLGVALHRGLTGATTVSTTMEIAARARVRLFATGGIGGVHRGYARRLDISSDLLAIARFPVGVVTSGVKSLLDVISTREALETLGVCVAGFGTEHFPAFYMRESGAGVDARFDDAVDLAEFVGAELARTGRGVVIANPIPVSSAIDREEFSRMLAEAEASVEGAGGGPEGRDVTPAILGALHRISAGKTLAANLDLVRANASLAAKIASSGKL